MLLHEYRICKIYTNITHQQARGNMNRKDERLHHQGDKNR
jgi:type IV secretory pathway VirB4 component